MSFWLSRHCRQAAPPLIGVPLHSVGVPPHSVGAQPSSVGPSPPSLASKQPVMAVPAGSSAFLREVPRVTGLLDPPVAALRGQHPFEVHRSPIHEGRRPSSTRSGGSGGIHSDREVRSAQQFKALKAKEWSALRRNGRLQAALEELWDCLPKNAAGQVTKKTFFTFSSKLRAWMDPGLRTNLKVPSRHAAGIRWGQPSFVRNPPPSHVPLSSICALFSLLGMKCPQSDTTVSAARRVSPSYKTVTHIPRTYGQHVNSCRK